MKGIDQRLGLTVPRDWATTSFGELCAKHGGELQTGPFGSQLHASDYSDEGVPVVMPQDMREGKLVTDKVARVDSEHVERLAHHKLKVGDIVYSRRGDVTRFAIAEERNVGWLCGTGCLRIRPGNAPLDRSFVRWFLEHPAVKKWLVDEAKGATMPNLNTSILSALPLFLPPLPEQKRIAAILDKADEIRRKRAETLRLTEELLKSAFLEMFGDPVTNPKGWEVRKLGEVISQIESGWSIGGDARLPREHEDAVLKISAVTSGWFEPDECKAVPVHDRVVPRPKRGDLLFSRANTRELVAATCLVVEDNPRRFLPDKLWRISTTREMRVEYLRYLLSFQGIRHGLTNQATGTSGSMLNVSKAKLLAYSVPIPPTAIQQHYAEAVWKIYGARHHVLHSAEQEQWLSAVLTQRAFRGEL